MTTTPPIPTPEKVRLLAEEIYRDTIDRLNRKLKSAGMTSLALPTDDPFGPTRVHTTDQESPRLSLLHEEAEQEVVRELVRRAATDPELHRTVREYCRLIVNMNDARDEQARHRPTLH